MNLNKQIDTFYECSLTFLRMIVKSVGTVFTQKDSSVSVRIPHYSLPLRVWSDEEPCTTLLQRYRHRLCPGRDIPLRLTEQGVLDTCFTDGTLSRPTTCDGTCRRGECPSATHTRRRGSVLTSSPTLATDRSPHLTLDLRATVPLVLKEPLKNGTDTRSHLGTERGFSDRVSPQQLREITIIMLDGHTTVGFLGV